MFQKIKNAYLLPVKVKILVLKALCYSLFYERQLKSKIFQNIKALHNNQTTQNQLSDQEIETMKIIARSINIIKKYAPWRPKCYNQALTAKRMLSNRNIETRLHIGFRKKEGKIEGHAWLTFKGQVVTGFIKGLKEYDTITGTDILQNPHS